MSALRSVVYVSTANGSVTTESLEALLSDARRYNLASGVTGVLLYGEGSYMQCFEGPDSAVRETYTRILASRQHRNIIELMNTSVERRSFEGWDMALIRPTHLNQVALSTDDWQPAAKPNDANPLTSSMGLDLLLAFWRGAGR